MNKNFFISTIIIFIIFFANFLYADGVKLDSLKSEIKSLQIYIEELQNEKSSLEKMADDLAIKVESIKKELKNKNDIIKEYRLNNYLKEAKNVSDKIVKINKDIEKNINLLSIKSQEIVLLYDKEIEITLKAMESSKEKRKEYMSEIVRLRNEKEYYNSLVIDTDNYPLVIYKVEINPFDSPEEVLEKVDTLKDMKDKTTKRITILNQRIKELKNEKRIKEKMNEFVEEIGFFDTGKDIARESVPAKPPELRKDKDKETTPVQTSSSFKVIIIDGEGQNKNIKDMTETEIENTIKKLEKKVQELKDIDKDLDKKIKEMEDKSRDLKKDDSKIK